CVPGRRHFRPSSTGGQRAGTARADRRHAPERTLPRARPGRGGAVTALAFELTPALEASEPPEARGLARDQVRLMVASRASGEVVHTSFRSLPAFLRPGDLIVINNSATLPAAVPATLANGEPIEVRFATRAPQSTAEDLVVVELRGAGGQPLPGAATAGEE